jgi:hypothetical protein
MILNRVGVDMWPALDDAMLKELGVTKLGLRVKFMAAVKGFGA